GAGLAVPADPGRLDRPPVPALPPLGLLRGRGGSMSASATLFEDRLGDRPADVGRRLPRGRRILLQALTLFLAVFALFPFVWTVASSLKSPSELVLFPPPLLPYQLQWKNYLDLTTVAPFWRWTYNSL